MSIIMFKLAKNSRFLLANHSLKVSNCFLSSLTFQKQPVIENDATQACNQIMPKKNQLIINPLMHDDFFQVKKLVTLDSLFKARVHYGHDAGLRCPWMSEYIFGTRIKTDIINLDTTIPLFQKALNFIAHIAFKNGIILLVTRYAQHIPLIERTALEAGEYSHCKPWNGGTFTDSMRRFGSVIRLPDLCIFFHTQEKLNEPHGAINEAAKMFIPTVAFCDTDVDPSLVTYPVPGNDDSMASVQLYANLVKQAILIGKNKRKEIDDQGAIVDYEYKQ